MELNLLANRVCKNYETLKAERSNWDSHWDEVARFVIPRKDNVYGQATIGEKKANRLFDTEAIRATDELAAALHGMLTNPSTVWFGLSTGDAEKDRNEKIRNWLHSSTKKMVNVLNNSNFQQEILETYTDLGSIGTGSLRMEDDEEEVIRFHSSPVYAVMIDENSRGDIDTVSRKYSYDKRQVLQAFGDNMDEETKKMFHEAQVTKKWEIIHHISPRTEMEKEGKVGNKAMKFMSVHVLVDKKIVLEESGFASFPYAIPRWTKINKEKYGRSPAMKVLSDIKMSNMMKKVIIQGAQLAIAPPLQVPDMGFLSPLKFGPYSTNYKRSGNNGDEVKPLFVGADPRIGVELLEMVNASIRQAFFLDKLNVNLGDRATATEVLQRKDEQLRTLGPILGRLNRELLKPIIDRLFAIMEAKNLFDDMPDGLKKGDNLDIKYVSAIAQAQVVTESDSMLRAINASGPIINLDPSVMDLIDGDKYLQKNLDIFGVDPSVIRSTAEVKEIREARTQREQELAQQQDALTSAETVNKLGGNSGAGEAG